MKVLHVVESLGSGVATALESYVRNTPDLCHVVCGYHRPGADTGASLDGVARFIPLPRHRAAQAVSARWAIRRERPAIVHLHSSFAGLYGRLLRPPVGTSTVYTPHCFAFERLDISPLTRSLYRYVERLLASNTTAFIAVSQREEQLASALTSTVPTYVVPHALVASDLPESHRRNEGRHITVATLGRIMVQKGIDFFLDVVDQTRALGTETASLVRWTWVGGGVETDEERLRAAGVHVTGWLPRSDALAALAEADVYVHTAAWEAAPLSVIEAAALGLPILVRAIPALQHGPFQAVDTAREMANSIAALTDADTRASASALSCEVAARYTPAEQRAALLAAYAEVLNCGPGVTLHTLEPPHEAGEPRNRRARFRLTPS